MKVWRVDTEWALDGVDVEAETAADAKKQVLQLFKRGVLVAVNDVIDHPVFQSACEISRAEANL